MTTPEGKVKGKLRKLLDAYTGMYTYWPVPFGYGRTTLDVLGCYRGRFFSVETKAEGKKPTLRQTMEQQAIERAMGRAFTISGMDSPEFETLRQWLDELTGSVAYDPRVTPDQTNRRSVSQRAARDHAGGAGDRAGRAADDRAQARRRRDPPA